MKKNNYCESCKFQFKDRASFMIHIQQTHKHEKTPLQKQEDLGRSQEIKIMPEEVKMAIWLSQCRVTREKYGVTKDIANKTLKITDTAILLDFPHETQKLIQDAVRVFNNFPKK